MNDKTDAARQLVLECIENDQDITEAEKKHIRELLTTPRKITSTEKKNWIPVKRRSFTDDFSTLLKYADEKAVEETNAKT